MAAVADLTGGGFFDSEVTLACGVEQANRLRDSSGRTGLVGRVLQVVDQYGAGGDELDTKRRYEQALREGHLNVRVLAPTEERKRRAVEVLRKHGGHYINFFGRLTIETLG
jgi:hypothetical protein